jgi:hypothetical protein
LQGAQPWPLRVSPGSRSKIGCNLRGTKTLRIALYPAQARRVSRSSEHLMRGAQLRQLWQYASPGGHALIRFSHSLQIPNRRNRDARTSAPAEDHKAVSLTIFLSARSGKRGTKPFANLDRKKPRVGRGRPTPVLWRFGSNPIGHRANWSQQDFSPSIQRSRLAGLSVLISLQCSPSRQQLTSAGSVVRKRAM